MPVRLLLGEEPIITTRPHWSVTAPAVAGAALALVAGVVIVALAPGSALGHDLSDLKLALQLAIVVVAACVAGIHLMRWRLTEYVLTTHRIVVSGGVLSRTSESIGLDRVQNIVVRQGLGARLIGCGDVEIESAGRDGAEVLRRIPQPQELENEIISASEQRRAPVAGTGRHLPTAAG